MHKTSPGGTFRIDRRFRGVGRLAVASGATTRAAYEARCHLLTALYNAGNLELLRAIQAGRVSVTEVYDAHAQDLRTIEAGGIPSRLASLTGDRALRTAPLWPAVRAWLPRSARAEETRKRYAVSARALERLLPADASVESLATVDWHALRASWAGGAADWNHLRRFLSRFLVLYLGGGKKRKGLAHPLRAEVLDAIGEKEPERPRIPDISPALFRAIVEAAPDHVQASLVTLAALGLRVGEYLRLEPHHLLPHTLSVAVPGTKTDASAAVVRVDARLWPWVVRAVPSPVRYGWLRKYWKRALKAAGADSTLRLHDLRHCFAQWLVDAGAPEAKVQQGMRHADASMTRQYAAMRDKGEVAGMMGDILAPKALRA